MGQSLTGFTLLELLLYVSISSILLLSITTLLGVLVQSRVKNQVIGEVEQQGVQIMQTMTQTIRNATAITTPAIGASAASLSLTVPTSAKSSTVFDSASSVVRITEGAGTAVSLSNSRITASGLTFQNLSRASTPGIVRIQFVLTHVNPSGRGEYIYTKTFYGSAGIR